MSFAINILALLLVLGLCWFAMVWLTGRFHGHGDGEEEFDLHHVAMPVTDPEAGAPCMTCEGVGASNDGGRVVPCGDCHGTGILS